MDLVGQVEQTDQKEVQVGQMVAQEAQGEQVDQ
jgi:uncharacterized protein YpmB